MNDGGGANTKVLTELGKCLFEAARLGRPKEVEELMKAGAPLITDWVSKIYFVVIYDHNIVMVELCFNKLFKK